MEVETLETKEVTVGKVLTEDELEERINVDEPFTYILSKPTTIADKTYTELNIDFDGLKGRDIVELAKIKGSISADANMNEFSKTYLMHYVARAAGITIYELMEFSAKDCTALTMAAQIFLMGAVSKLPKK